MADLSSESVYFYFLENVRLDADAAGRFVAAWGESEYGGSPLVGPAGRTRIRARRFGADGQPLAPAIEVEEAPEGRSEGLVGDVAVRPDGSFLAL